MKALKSNLRKRRLALAGVRPEASPPLEVFGEAQGGWTLCPSGLTKDAVVYSVGVGTDISFDLDLIDRLGATVHAFDPTPACVAWIREQSLPASFVFHPTGIADLDGTLDFHPPRKAESVHFTPVKRYRKRSGTTVRAPVRRLKTLMDELGHDRIDLLKIDIEGGEYGVIRDLTDNPVPVRQLLVEFHHNYPSISFRQTVEAVHSLRGAGFLITNISPRSYEISFLHGGAG